MGPHRTTLSRLSHHQGRARTPVQGVRPPNDRRGRTLTPRRDRHTAPPRGETFETDVAVVGAGAAGVAAGIEARDAGARVVVIEQFDAAGGTAIISGGGCLVVDTPLQQQSEIEDGPELAIADWLAWGGPTVDADWARFYVEHSLHDVYHWAETHGIRWIGLSHHEGNTVPRWTRPKNGGLGMMRALIAAFDERGGKLLTSTKVRRLLVEDGRVCGLEGRRGEDVPIRIRARAVVVATGGFASNLEMVLTERPDLARERILLGSGRGATGSGHRLVAAAGGASCHMDNIWFYVHATPDPRDTSEHRGFVFRKVPGNVWVNQRGERFHNEALSGGKSALPALLAQRPRHCWAVLDSAMAKSLEIADPYYQTGDVSSRERVNELLETSPHIKKGHTLEQLAIATGMPTAVFAQTITRYNSFFAAALERDPDHGKPLAGCSPLGVAPYYAIQMFPLARKTLGGVRTDLRCRVLDEKSEPIAGLYAAGEVAGMAGGHINGAAALEGTMLGPSLFSGRVAGGWAAKQAGVGRGFVGTPAVSPRRSRSTDGPV
ncbi:FAD-dependent oxidoreductase [Georgenia alba]|uniref:FAD-dependent oxidoreductase n=1 Tax=Georgenia alba TaxID=2233858 RepID=A0ABW2QB99_9MICO